MKDADTRILSSTRPRRSWTYRIGIFFLALALIAEAYLIFFDRNLFPSRSRSGEAEIAGVLQTGYEQAKTQERGSLSWRQTTENAPLFFGDKIMTSNESSALIQFQEGESLVLEPQSLIEIEKNADEMTNGPIRIRLAQGRFRSKGSHRPIEIRVGESRLITHSDSDIDIDEKGKIQVLSGGLDVKTGSQTLNVKEGQEVTKSPKGDLQIQSIDFYVMTPSSGESIPASTKEVVFEWKGFPSQLETSEPLVIEIAKEKSFLRPILSHPIAGTTRPRASTRALLSFPETNPPTLYYWRLKGVRSHRSSETYFFTMISPETAAPLFPLKKARMSSSNEIDFRWKTVSKASGYRLTLTLPSGEKKVLESQSPHIQWKPDEIEGRVRWEVCYQNSTGEWSEAGEPSEIEFISDVPPPPPELNDAKIEKQKN